MTAPLAGKILCSISFNPNREQYFTCPPDSGIFIDPRALRVRKALTKNSPGDSSSTAGTIQPSKIPIPSRSLLRKPENRTDSTSIRNKPISKKPSLASVKSSSRPNDPTALPNKPANPRKKDHTNPTVVTDRSPNAKPKELNLPSPEFHTRFVSEDLDARTLSYLASENANPAIVVSASF